MILCYQPNFANNHNPFDNLDAAHAMPRSLAQSGHWTMLKKP